MRTLLVDDEALSRLRLRSLLLACNETPTEVIGEAGDAQQALERLQAGDCDLVLLDIRMPGRDGLQLAAALRSLPNPPSVVFVTAHSQHALRAFDLDAVDYLTKPVQRNRLQAALHRVVQRRAPISTRSGDLDEAPVLLVNDRSRVLRIPVSEVLYLKAELKYVTLRTALRSHVLDEPLSDLEQRLAALGSGFIRIHRNALVARAAVRELQRRHDSGADEGWAVRVAPLDEWLPVSRRQAAAVREALAGDSA
ncbi:MAG TPA: LytTR family DNA-binding domain-containing protein [Rubrivivax sp.]